MSSENFINYLPLDFEPRSSLLNVLQSPADWVGVGS